MKFIKHYIIILFSLISLFSCQLNNDLNNNKPDIVTTIFPLYDFTKQITKDKVNVELVLPPGVEPHSFEPKPRSIFEIRKADLFIYTGDFLEVWALNIIDVLDSDKVINTSTNVTLIHNHEHIDPHIWIDPENAKIMVDNILNSLIKIDPDNKTFYEENASDYKAQLEELNLCYQDLFANVKHKTIIFGGHYVFGYLSEKYNIKYVSPYKGYSPDTLPTPRNIHNLIKLLNNTDQNTLFYEEIINPEVAEIIAKETKAKLLPLNGAGNVSKSIIKNNLTYLDIMYQNIERLKEGLGYNE